MSISAPPRPKRDARTSVPGAHAPFRRQVQHVEYVPREPEKAIMSGRTCGASLAVDRDRSQVQAQPERGDGPRLGELVEQAPLVVRLRRWRRGPEGLGTGQQTPQRLRLLVADLNEKRGRLGPVQQRADRVDVAGNVAGVAPDAA